MTLSQLSWKVQGWGLVLLTFLSFFPVLFHVEEYLFFGILIVLTGGTFWWEGKFVLPRSPIDVPLILFVVWVSLTLPFSAHPAYSFSEWLKLVAQVLVFYWTLLVLMKAQSRYFSRWVLAAVVCGAAVINGHSLIEYVVSHGALLWPGQVRIDFFHSSAQWLVTYGVIALPLIVAAGAIVKGAYYRFLCAFVFGVTMVGGAYAMSRAGWLAVMVQAGTFGIMGNFVEWGSHFWCAAC